MAVALLSKEENTVMIFARRIMSKFLNNAAFIASHVIGLISHVSISIQLQMFSIRFTFGDCRGYSILCLSLFSNHANTVMALWQRTLSYWNTNGCCWSSNICSFGSSQFSCMRSIWECWLRFSSKTTKLTTPWMLMHPRTKAETCLRSRNYIASGFILYPFSSNIFHPIILHLHASESTTMDHLSLVLQCWILLAHLMWFWRFWYEPWGFFCR